jgi:hypothetical protein
MVEMALELVGFYRGLGLYKALRCASGQSEIHLEIEGKILNSGTCLLAHCKSKTRKP